MSDPDELRRARLRNGGEPITDLWAWVVIDADGREAVCRSPWSESAALVTPDLENIAAPGIAEWCRHYYGNMDMRVELRRFTLVPK